MEFDALRAAVVPGAAVVGRWPGVVCVAECGDRRVLRRLLDVCAAAAGPEPGRALARRLTMWLGGHEVPPDGLRFGTVAVTGSESRSGSRGEQWAVFLYGSVGLVVPDRQVALSGAQAVAWTDRLLPRPDVPVVLALEGGPIPPGVIDGVHDLRSGVVPGAGAVLVPGGENRSTDSSEEAVRHRPEDPLWVEPGERERPRWSGATPEPALAAPADGLFRAGDGPANGVPNRGPVDDLSPEARSDLGPEFGAEMGTDRSRLGDRGRAHLRPVPSGSNGIGHRGRGPRRAGAFDLGRYGGGPGRGRDGAGDPGDGGGVPGPAVGGDQSDTGPPVPDRAEPAADERQPARPADETPGAPEAAPTGADDDTTTNVTVPTGTDTERPPGEPGHPSGNGILDGNGVVDGGSLLQGSLLDGIDGTGGHDAPVDADPTTAPSGTSSHATSNTATSNTATSNTATSSTGTNGAGINFLAGGGLGTNGLNSNGQGSNGQGSNGLGSNDLGGNGTGPNGTGPNGTGPNGTSHNGPDPNGTGSNGGSERGPWGGQERPGDAWQEPASEGAHWFSTKGEEPSTETELGVVPPQDVRRPRHGRQESTPPASGPEGAEDEASAGTPKLGVPRTASPAAGISASLPAPVPTQPPGTQPPGTLSPLPDAELEPPVTAPAPLRAEQVQGAPVAEPPRPPLEVGLPAGGATEVPEYPFDDSQVRGNLCPRGHLNDPRLSLCAFCGERVDENGGQRVAGPRPALGLLVFDDGSTYTADAEYLVGRMPEGDPRVVAGALRSLSVEDPSGAVSRVHAEVRLSGWDVLLTDAGSRNGTYLSAPGDPEWTQLPAGQPQRLVPGTRVRLGGRSFQFESPSGAR